MRSIYLLITIAFVWSVISTASLMAQDIFNWTNMSGGTFSDGANWDQPSAPADTNDIARFNTGNHPAYTVNFTANFTNYQAQIGSDASGDGTAVIWDLGGYTYNLSYTNSAMVIGEDCRASLLVTNGMIDAGGPQFILGTGNGDPQGTLILAGTNTSWQVFNITTRMPEIGRDSSTNESLLRIEQGAEMTLIRMRIGSSQGAHGAVVLDGTNSRLTTGHTVALGSYGHGRMEVKNGAYWQQNGNGLTISAAVLGSHDGSGRLTIDGGTMAAKNFTVGELGTLAVTLHTGGTNTLIELQNATTALNLQSATTNATLEINLAPDFQAEIGDTFKLMEHTGVTTLNITGQFMHEGKLLSDGDHIVLGGSEAPILAGYKFRYNITDGLGGGVTLTTVGVPISGTLFLFY